MTYSMTAFARRERATTWGGIAWEVRSVNHRFLETALRLPEDLRSLDPKAREVIAARVTRGRIDASLTWRPIEASDNIELDPERLARVVTIFQSIETLNLKTVPPSMLDLLRWPGVMRTPALDMEGLSHEVVDLLGEALDELAETRKREGVRMKQFLLDRITSVERHVETVRKILPDVTKAYRDRLSARLAEARARPVRGVT